MARLRFIRNTATGSFGRALFQRSLPQLPAFAPVSGEVEEYQQLGTTGRGPAPYNKAQA